MSEEKRLRASNAFVMCETSYCPLIWSFSNKRNLGIIDRIHKGANRVICGNSQLTSSFSAHRQHCELLLSEIYKVNSGTGPSYMDELFHFKNHTRYDLRNSSTVLRRRVRTTRHGLLSLSHVGAQLWDSIPNSIKNATSVSDFRQKLRSIEHLRCTCHLCST